MLLFLLLLFSCASTIEKKQKFPVTSKTIQKNPLTETFRQVPPELDIKKLKLLLFKTKNSVSIEATNLKTSFFSASSGKIKCQYRKKKWRCLNNGKWHPLIYNLDNEFSTSTGFMKINNKFYRDLVLLHPKGRTLYVLTIITLDHYLSALVKNELPPNSPDEAIIAQLIAARSYALATAYSMRTKKALYDLKITQSDQVYSHSLDENPRATRLVKKISHKYLTYNNLILKSYYHACSGGLSETPNNAWGKSSQSQAFRSRLSPVDQKIKRCLWNYRIHKDYGHLLKIGTISDIQIVKKTSGERVKILKLVGSKKTINLTDMGILKKFGNRNIRSFLFDVHKIKNSWHFKGRGWGHGVGLSQMGAIAMADFGLTHENILNFYYPGAKIETILTTAAPSPK